ncbi:hypothetical protein [Aeromicrobium duanguangcaii]|uniref:hypothetical protein n=1 Tax=Aeromicrobium duanguangcaii TaxID=2968086 RepID=UPI0020177119|nr:hypothetical protein [Aeromicrobium duanguangcaii]MCL3836646.1 hypothetical protein [Aeromicrobium duanguangcaii]
MAYYYCLKHHAVEGDHGCKAADRMGPYETEDEASRALEIAREKTKAWDEDPKWNDDVPESGSPE